MSRTENNNRNRNIAARMGRWSAAHWKTATFGWLAFVVVAFALAAWSARRASTRMTTAPVSRVAWTGSSTPGFKQPAGESVLIQSRSARVSDPAFAAAIRDVVARVSTVAVVERRSPLAPQVGEIAKDGHAALVEFDDPRRQDEGGRQDRARPRPRRQRAAGPPRAFHRRVRRSERGRRRSRRLQGRPGEGRPALAPDHAVHPPAHLRRARRRRHSAAARADRRLRDVRPARAAQPPAPVADEAPALVLLIGLAVGVDYSMFYLKREREERAAGRSERAALEAAAATSGRSVLISGLTVMAAMAGHVPDRRHDVRVVRLATMIVVAVAVLGSLPSCRPCSPGSATTSTGCASRLSAGTAATTAKAGSGARSSTASCAGPCSPRSSPAGCWSALAVPRSSCSSRHERAGHVPAVAPVVQATTGCSRLSRARRSPRTWSSRRRT